MRYILPFYHSVSDVPLPHLMHLYKVKSTQEFKRDLDFFCKHYEIVDLDTFIRASKNQFQSISKPVCHLSFDDGLKECHSVIAPILFERGIPSTFFINPSFIDNKQLFYRLKTSLLLSYLFENKGIAGRLLKDKMGWRNPQQELRSLNYGQQKKLDEAAAILNLDFNACMLKQPPYMTQNDIKELMDQGFTIGAHSMDHPEFRQLSFKDQKSQVVESMRAIDDFGFHKHKVFSFPFTDTGVRRELFNVLQSEAIVDASFGTAGMKHDSVSMNFQRVPMENGLEARNTLLFQTIKCYLRSCIGINSIERG